MDSRDLTDREAESQQEKVANLIPNMVTLVHDRFTQAETARQNAEKRWLKAYRDYRGMYGSDVVFKDAEKSRVFVKIAKAKTLAAYGQLQEVVFAANKFPIGIKSTERPEGVAEVAHLPSNPKPDSGEQIIPPGLDFGFAGDGHDNAAARLSKGSSNILGGMAADFPPGAAFVAGSSPNPADLEIYPAKKNAEEMEKTIHDQLTETHAARELREALFESALYGTGIVKGPFNYIKTLHRWNVETPDKDKFGSEIKKEYDPQEVTVPYIEAVSVWNWYPDPSAMCVEECEWTIERHKLNRSQLRGLLKRPYFNKAAIRTCLMRNPNYQRKDFEHQITDSNFSSEQANRWEVLEYWGVMDVTTAQEAGLDLGEDVDALDEVQLNVWVCEDQILRIVMNPFEPERLPYHIFPYEKNPHEIFGIGVPENMSDSTQIMNGHARMAIDNLAISGNLVFDVDESALVTGQSMEMYPGKIFRRQTGQPGQSVYGLKFPNTTQENMMMFDRFRQLADEQTGIPSYSHGTTGVQSTTRTASGMSMLMGAAALNIKTVVKNLDDYLLKPLGEAMFHWNMQFNPDLSIQGDLEVKAMGTEAIMQKEVKSQRLIQFLQVVANPALAPFAKLHMIIQEIAKTLDLDPEEFTNNPEEAALYAKIIGMAGGVQGSESPTPDAPGGATGNGNATIGTGNVPQPGEKEFSGNKGLSANADAA